MKVIQHDESPSQTHTCNFLDVLACMQKNSTEKSKDDEMMIADAIKSINYFQENIDSKININEFSVACLNYLKLESFPEATIILGESDISDRLYIILKGNIRRYEKKNIEEIELEYQQVTGQVIKNLHDYSKKANYSKKKAETMHIFAKKLTFSLVSPESKKKKQDNLQSIPRDINSKKSKKTKRMMSSPREELIFAASPTNNEQQYHFIDKSNSYHNEIDDLAYIEHENNNDDGLIILPKFPKKKEKKGYLMSDIELFHKVLQQRGGEDQISHKFYLGGILKYKCSKVLGPGMFFGEHFIKSMQSNKFTYITYENCEIMTLKRDDYFLIIKELTDKMEDKVIFFRNVFPHFAEEITTKLAYYFTEKSFKKDDIIYKQGDICSRVYILRNGNVQICHLVDIFEDGILPSKQKNNNLVTTYNVCKSPRKNKKILKIANFTETQLFGDELFLPKPSIRHFTAINNTHNTIVYELEASIYVKIRSLFPQLFKELAEQARSKLEWREKRLNELLKMQKDNNQPKIPKPLEKSKPNLLGISFEELKMTFCGPFSARENLTKQKTNYCNNPIESPVYFSENKLLLNEKDDLNLQKTHDKYKELFGRGNYDSIVRAHEEYLQKHAHTNQNFYVELDHLNTKTKKSQNHFLPLNSLLPQSEKLDNVPKIETKYQRFGVSIQSSTIFNSRKNSENDLKIKNSENDTKMKNSLEHSYSPILTFRNLSIGNSPDKISQLRRIILQADEHNLFEAEKQLKKSNKDCIKTRTIAANLGKIKEELKGEIIKENIRKRADLCNINLSEIPFDKNDFPRFKSLETPRTYKLKELTKNDPYEVKLDTLEKKVPNGVNILKRRAQLNKA